MNNPVQGRVIFRADGSTRMGLGHVVRSSALAGMISGEWECELFTRCTVAPVLSDAASHFRKVTSLDDSADLAEEAKILAAFISSDDIVVLDGYHFRESYQQIMRATGAKVISIDDIHSCTFLSDVVINTAGGLSINDYKSRPSTQFYLGPRLALLREPFLQAAASRKAHPVNRSVLVSLGGSDPDNVTLDIVRMLVDSGQFGELCIVTGGGYLYMEALRDFISSRPVKARIFNSVTSTEFAELMTACSYAVCAPSTVSYEYMTVGGVVYLKQIADNQADMLHYLTSEGLAFHLQDLGKITEEQELASLQKQATVFDGKSGERIRSVFRGVRYLRDIAIRKATATDLMLCFSWANDPDVRAQSYNQEEIQLEQHQQWYLAKMKEKDCYFYILEIQGVPVAQIRFQVKEDIALIGYLIDRNWRSKGLGAIVLSKGIERFISEYGNRIKLTGFVKQSNIASQRSFGKMAFIRSEAPEMNSFKYTMEYYGS